MNTTLLGAKAVQLHSEATAVAVASEWTTPSHQELDLAQINPDDFGIEPFGSVHDCRLYDCIEEAKYQKEQVRELKTLLDWALYHVRRRRYVFPCWPRSKAPATKHGFKDSSNDPDAVRAWWTENPNYNIGVDLGRSGLVVVDYDAARPFADAVPTETVRTGREAKDGIEGIQMYYRGSCKTRNMYVDATGKPSTNDNDKKIGEVRGRGAYVLGAGSIHPSGRTYTIIDFRPLAESPEQNEPIPVVAGPAIGTDEQNEIADYVEAAFDEAGVDYLRRQNYKGVEGGGFQWNIICPWDSLHTSQVTEPTSSSSVIMFDTGKLIYECKHRCLNVRQWKELRHWMQEKVGHHLVFGKSGDSSDIIILPLTESKPANDKPIDVPDVTVDESSTDSIPAFDPSVVNGIYKKFVDLITRGTTMAPQFPFLIAKVVVGARMAGKVRFETLDAEPRYYGALIGETGSGKGESWRRMSQILNPTGSTSTPSDIKIISSADSGAGLRDFFFEPPQDQTVICYIDEVVSLGNKATATRNPAILDTMIELADSTQISRVLAKKKNGPGTKSKSDARLCMVMCGQDGDVFMQALAGRTKLGMFDRLYPEFGVAVEAGDLPAISPKDAIAMLMELNSLDFSGTMTMSAEARDRLEQFWAAQPADVRKKARFKKNLALDAYMAAFGRGVKQVGLDDLEIAIGQFTRQLVIRRVCFRSEAPDRIGFYLGKIKDLTSRMQRQLAAGIPREQVALSRRDYETLTHAHRDNEGHIFERAWKTYEPVWLTRVPVQRANGQKYDKYLPVTE